MISRRHFVRQSATAGVAGILAPTHLWTRYTGLEIAALPPSEGASLNLCAHACDAAYALDQIRFMRLLRSPYSGYDGVIEIYADERGVRGYLAYSRRWSTAILVFRGTDNWSNVWDDADWNLVSLWGGSPVRSYYAGFWGAYASVRSQIRPAVEQAYEKMGGVFNYLFITGHSMGASLAMLARMDAVGRLNQLSRNTHVETNLIAFPNSGNQTFIDWQSAGTMRYVYHYGDPVTANSTFPTNRTYWRPLTPPAFTNAHSISTYIDSIRAKYGRTLDRTHGVW